MDPFPITMIIAKNYFVIDSLTDCTLLLFIKNTILAKDNTAGTYDFGLDC